jgi:hypothetical protein
VRRTLTNLAALGVLAAKVPASKLGLIRGTCGWRRTTGIGLKSVASKFTLTAFGLHSGYQGTSRVTASDTVFERLSKFFTGEPSAALRIVERRGCLVGTLTGDGCTFRYQAGVRDDPRDRFVPPDLCTEQAGGDHVIDVVCRLSPDLRVVDVWMQFNHAAVDGVPMQEMLSRLQRAWGEAEDVTYPAPGESPRSRPWHLPGERPIHHLSDFLDFAPLLAARRNPETPARPAVAALLLWHLAKQDGFRDKRFASTVDVPPAGDEPRCVDFVVIRPADFADLPSFSREFDRQVEACRTRRSATRAAMQTLALLPPRLALAALKLNAERTNETFGTVGLSILRDARVFLAPMSDTGFDDGFLSIGNMELPCADGRRVGSVSVKGDAGKPEALLEAIRAAVRGVSTT